jgi:hypothetical protein
MIGRVPLIHAVERELADAAPGGLDIPALFPRLWRVEGLAPYTERQVRAALARLVRLGRASWRMVDDVDDGDRYVNDRRWTYVPPETEETSNR